MRISDHKYSLILDYISGELTEEARAEVELWIKSSSENEKIYKEILRKSLYLQWSLKEASIDQDIEFDKFERRLNVKTIYLRFAAVAASFLLILGLGVFFIDTQITPELAEVVTIEPGQKGAELILSNGEKLQISSSSKLIKEENGSLIQIDSLKGIVYKDQNQTDKLIYNTIKVSRGQEFNLMLADGTRVWMNAESELKFPVQFLSKERKVFLKGEAYFEVAPDDKKAFVVNSFDQDLKVYGTKFNINAYDENLIKTVLVEGQVGVKLIGLDHEVKMSPGELLSAHVSERKMNVDKVDVYPYIAWKDGEFRFQNESLDAIMLRLERWYDVKVFFKDDNVRQTLFVGDLKRYDEIGRLLYFMEKSSNVKFEIKDDVVIVMSK